MLNRFSAASLANFSMPSTFRAAFAGARLGSRPRIRCSTVLDTVIAAVPASPAASPMPTFAANVAAFMTGAPRFRT